MKVAGYAGRPLFKKLGMKPFSAWKIINAPRDYHELLGDGIADVSFVKRSSDLDGVHFFAQNADQIESALNTYRDQIKKNGMIWISWYKKSSKIATDVTEDVIRDTALAMGLVDVKVCAVDEQWSALKIVWRKENR